MTDEIKSPPLRPFWQELGIILGLDIAAVALLSLIFMLIGSQQFVVWLSNLFFISSVGFLIVAVIPMFGDMGDSGKILKQMKKEGKIVSRETMIDLDQERRRARMTYSYGLAAVAAFVLAFASLVLG
jgi:hypothetical protein